MKAPIDSILEAQLDHEQLVVAAEVDCNVLVLAPPGSGKTRVLVNAAAHRIRHASAITGRDHSRVMCLTFGTDAAREMRQRLHRRPLSIPPNRVWVGNYHGVSSLLLRRYGHLIGWPRNAGILGATEPVVAEAIHSLGIKGLQARNMTGAISNLKGNRTADDVSDKVRAVRERYDELLRERNMRDYDDIIAHACELLATQPRVRTVLHHAYPFVFVDELQDTNVAQLELLGHLIGADTTVFGVADDDQMIYGWRDAHPENLDTFIDWFSAGERPLVGNYRCPPTIVSAANRIINLNTGRRKTSMESRVTTRDGELIIVSASSVNEAEAVAVVIQRCFDDGYSPGQIALLAPHTFKFDEVAGALKTAGIPYVRPGATTIADNPVIKVLSLCFRCLSGVTLAGGDVAGLAGEQPAEDIISTIEETSESASTGSSRGLLNRLLKELDLGSTADPKRSADEIKVLATMIRKATDDHQPSSSAELAELILRDWQRLERAALESAEAVKLMTSFAAKGTEYPVVVMPYLNDGLVPYKRRNEDIDWPAARRLFYVALTRTERRAILIHNANLTPSELLDAVRGDATEVIQL